MTCREIIKIAIRKIGKRKIGSFAKYLPITLLFCVNTSFAQNNTFTLSGKVDMPAGTIVLVPAYDSLLYPTGNYYYETQISKGTFRFTGDIKYTIPMILAIKEGDKLRYRSTRFFLDSGNQSADWRTNNMQSTDAHVGNPAMDEWKAYEGIFATVNNRLHELTVALNSLEPTEANVKIKSGLELEQQQQQRTKDSLILAYTRQHPNSMLPLWDVVKLLDKGYSPFLDSFSEAMSQAVHYTLTGHQFVMAVDKLKLTVKGNTFPLMSLTGMDGQRTNVSTSDGTNKYTLIDFWYSSCYPCLRLFPGLKKVYDAYHSKGFEIIAVSIDEGKYVDAWKKLISERGLNWQQYLDTDKRMVQKLHIQRYPTNFLVDEYGKILEQDIHPEALEQFLEERLK